MEERQTTVMVYKNEGETPLECLMRFRIEQPLYKNAILSYAGRLDPMAEGMLLVLVDEENKKRGEYLGLDKTYEVEVLLALSTDTGDILGLVQEGHHLTFENPEHILTSSVGPFVQKYPQYSSRTVHGKPLFQWAREGRLGEIEIPERTSKIYSIELLQQSSLTGAEILLQVNERISKVHGDFRQRDILESWKNALSHLKEKNFPLLKIRVKCSSGTYMRTLAEEIGKKAGTSALAWRIKRLSYDSPLFFGEQH